MEEEERGERTCDRRVFRSSFSLLWIRFRLGGGRDREDVGVLFRGGIWLGGCGLVRLSHMLLLDCNRVVI
jgi:hypothetical protein